MSAKHELDEVAAASGLVLEVTAAPEALAAEPDVQSFVALAIEMADWDPQKIGKNIGAYDFAESAVAAVYNNVKQEKAAA